MRSLVLSYLRGWPGTGKLIVLITCILLVIQPLTRLAAQEPDSKAATRASAKRIVAEADQLREQGSTESLRQAVEKYEESIRLYREIQEQNGLATALARRAATYAGLEEKHKAIAGYEEVVSICDGLKDHICQADALYQAGVLLDELNEKPKAIEILNRSLTIVRTLKDRARIAATLYYLGTVHNDLLDREKAIACLKEAIDLYRAADDRRGEAMTLSYLGDVYLALSDNDKALSSYHDELKLRQELEDRQREADTLSDIALVYFVTGKTQEAIDSLKDALKIARDLGDLEQQAITELGLGIAYSSIMIADEAVDHLKKSLILAREWGADEGIAVVLITSASVYAAMGKIDAALAAHAEARPLLKKLNMPQAEMASAFSLGLLHLAKDEYRSALEFLERARSLAQQIHEERTAVWALTLIGLTHFLNDQNKEAVEKLSVALPRLQALGDRLYQATALGILASIERDRGDLLSAKSRIEAALVLIESMRTSVISPELRVSFFSSVHDFFNLYIDLLMRLHKQLPRAGFAMTALEASERSRSRGLVELLNEAGIDIRQGVDPKLLEQETALRQKLNSAIQSRVGLLGRMYSPEQGRMSASEIEKAKIEHRDLQARIRQVSPRYADLTQPQPLTLQDMQALLDPDTLLLEYKLDADQSYLWLVSKTEAQIYVLPSRSEIETLAGRFYGSLTRASRLATPEMVQDSSRLSQILLGPVASQLGRKRLVIVADGALQYLPFAALTDPASKQPLIVNHELVSLPSLSVLATLRSESAKREQPSSELAILADPVFNKSDARVKQNGRQVQAKDQTLNQRQWDRLKGTRLEAEKITALLGANKATKLLDFAANRETAVSGALSKYRHVLFATHAEVSDLQSELSAVVLSLVDENGNARNGYLRLNDIYNMKLSAELVVLSGCQTALGPEVKGEGLIGLTRGFMYAGAKGVLASLWRVDDVETPELIIRFYRGVLKEGKRPAEALRAAQLELLRSEQWKAPHYWAAFALQGEWR